MLCRLDSIMEQITWQQLNYIFLRRRAWSSEAVNKEVCIATDQEIRNIYYSQYSEFFQFLQFVELMCKIVIFHSKNIKSIQFKLLLFQET